MKMTLFDLIKNKYFIMMKYKVKYQDKECHFIKKYIDIYRFLLFYK